MVAELLSGVRPRTQERFHGENLEESFFESTATESQARADAVLPSKGSEDASGLLHRWAVAKGRDKAAEEDRDYLPNAKVDWVVHVEFPAGTVLKKAAIQKAFSPSWCQQHNYPTLFGFSPEGGRWTFVFAGGVPESYSKLQLGWQLCSLDDYQPRSAKRLDAYLAAAQKAGQMLKAASVRPDKSAKEGAAQSARLLELVECCDVNPMVVLKATDKAGFDGKSIWDVMLSLGLHWGDMDLFHWENPGIPGDDHLLSVSTTTPPGYFFPEEIAAGRVHTADLVFGFSVPRTGQPEVVADSMLQAVQYAKRRLGGQIVEEDGSKFSEKELKLEIKETVKFMTKAGFPPGSEDAMYLF